MVHRHPVVVGTAENKYRLLARPERQGRCRGVIFTFQRNVGGQPQRRLTLGDKGYRAIV